MSFIKSTIARLSQLHKKKSISILGVQHHEKSVRWHILNQQRLCDSLVIKINEGSGIELSNAIADSWVCCSIEVLLMRGVITDMKSGNVYLPKADAYILETGWGWGKYKSASTTRNMHFNKKILNSENPVYCFTSSGYHGIVEDIGIILKLNELGYKFDVAISKNNTWMLSLLKNLLPKTIQLIQVESNVLLSSPLTLSVTKSMFGEFPHRDLIMQVAGCFNRAAVSSSNEKIFVARSKTTKRNYHEYSYVAYEYKDRGYDIVILEDLSVSQQLALFGNASHVAGFHGAGLTNIIWSNRGLRLHEFYCADHFNSSFSTLSFYLGHQYQCTKLN